MIGITFCGETGEGAPVTGGTLMNVTCASCKSDEPDPRRFRGAPIPLTINGSYGTVHAGELHHKQTLTKELIALERDAVGFVFDVSTREKIVDLIRIERARIAEEGV